MFLNFGLQLHQTLYLLLFSYHDRYVNLSQKQYNDVINLSYKFAQESDMEVIPIDLKLSEDKQERTKQFNQVYSFLQEHSYPLNPSTNPVWNL